MVRRSRWPSTPGCHSARRSSGAGSRSRENDHLDPDLALGCDWIAISHEHQDHLDAALLRRLPPSVTVVIPAYPSGSLRRRIEATGVRRIIEVAAWERLALDAHGSWLTTIPERSPMCHDAAFLVVSGGRSVLHCNDARLTTAQVRRATAEVGSPIDVMAVQTSGASWYPICYDYEPAAMAAMEERKRLGKFRAVAALARRVPPRLLIPFAGPPCFLDPEVAVHNRSVLEPGMFPDAFQAARWLWAALPDQAVRVLRPGDRLDVEPGELWRHPALNGIDLDFGGDRRSSGRRLERLLASYRRDRRDVVAEVHASHPSPGDGLADRFADHMVRLGGLSSWCTEQIAMTVRFEVGGPWGGRWDVTFDGDGAHVDLGGRHDPVSYCLSVEGRWLEPVLKGEVGWEDLLLSLRVGARRQPDEYNDYLIGLLKHADADALGAVEHYEATDLCTERIVVQGDQGSVEVTRSCPHAGEDLATGSVVEGGTLRCLGHNYTFDLATGECTNARCRPLAVRPLDREVPVGVASSGSAVRPFELD